MTTFLCSGRLVFKDGERKKNLAAIAVVCEETGRRITKICNSYGSNDAQFLSVIEGMRMAEKMKEKNVRILTNCNVIISRMKSEVKNSSCWYLSQLQTIAFELEKKFSLVVYEMVGEREILEAVNLSKWRKKQFLIEERRAI